jgi:hypothetical protein
MILCLTVNVAPSLGTCMWENPRELGTRRYSIIQEVSLRLPRLGLWPMWSLMWRTSALWRCLPPPPWRLMDVLITRSSAQLMLVVASPSESRAVRSGFTGGGSVVLGGESTHVLQSEILWTNVTLIVSGKATLRIWALHRKLDFTKSFFCAMYGDVCCILWCYRFVIFSICWLVCKP